MAESASNEISSSKALRRVPDTWGCQETGLELGPEFTDEHWLDRAPALCWCHEWNSRGSFASQSLASTLLEMGKPIFWMKDSPLISF